MVAAMCSTCGLPEELCVCEDVAKSDMSVSVTLDERRFDKVVTLVNNLDPSEVDVESLASELKSTLACGGTIQEDGTIELQGNHTDRIKPVLEENGYKVSN